MKVAISHTTGSCQLPALIQAEMVVKLRRRGWSTRWLDWLVHASEIDVYTLNGVVGRAVPETGGQDVFPFTLAVIVAKEVTGPDVDGPQVGASVSPVRMEGKGWLLDMTPVYRATRWLVTPLDQYGNEEPTQRHQRLSDALLAAIEWGVTNGHDPEWIVIDDTLELTLQVEE